MDAAGNPTEMPTDSTAHVLIFPFPIQGHVNGMLKLAELLSKTGLHVTFLNSDYNHDRLSRSSSAYALLAQSPRFRFDSISDGLADENPRSAFRLMELEESLRTRSAVQYRELLTNRGRGDDGKWPPVTCVIADGAMTFAVDIAEELGIPAIAFRTISACSFWAYFCIPRLLQNGELPFPDEADLDEPVRSVPGMEAFLRRRDLPSFCRQAGDEADQTFEFVTTVTANTNRARALILNTFESLEATALSHVRSHFPVTYAVGPLPALLRSYGSHCPSNPAVSPTSSMPSASLWEEDRTCMTWLDSQPHKSVVYVSFGSLTVVSQEAFLEFWIGLVNSGQRFLWVVRPDLVEEEMLPLPEEVKVGTKERGCLVDWVPQEQVLAHPAVGCFLTHSGWNSTLESLVAGVPMLCWPFFADQQINSRFVSEVWKVGLDMKDLCSRSIVEMMVREVMEGQRTDGWRRSAREMAKMAWESVAEGGSSHADFRRLIQRIMSLSSHGA
ncbi:7-deoxyloganetic acid glucosyltransferase [Elaeis guineensis]|uniref:Glycosyltransferase n=1 Tax=Elaeis guineensis var. tenera TaxID=51953 RepID=A0A6I9Q9X0_ELAGV|nr:7-deoxyloganetic acid glucosyltransferase [Elaeis guineensis]